MDRLISARRLAALCIVAAINLTAALASEEQSDFVTALMRSTFKIEGDGILATAFIMGQPAPHSPDYMYFVMLTAAHVLDAIQGQDVTVHFRTHNDGVYRQSPCSYRIRDDNGAPLWIKHPDVDIAAMRISLPLGIDMQLVSTDLFATDSLISEFGVRPGDRVFALGFPHGIASSDAGFPVIRTGYIAGYPLIPTSSQKTFLMDFRVFHGNSGGPVIYEATHTPFETGKPTGTVRLMMGLVSEQLELKEPVQTLTETSVRSYELSLAAIVHAQFLKDILTRLPPASGGQKPSCTSP